MHSEVSSEPKRGSEALTLLSGAQPEEFLAFADYLCSMYTR